MLIFHNGRKIAIRRPSSWPVMGARVVMLDERCRGEAWCEVGMNRLRNVLWAMSIASLAGCSGGPALNAHVETLNNEYRHLEDEMFALQAENQKLCNEVELLERELERSRGGSYSGGSGLFRRTPRPPARSGSEPGIDLSPPVIEGPGSDMSPSLEPPEISPPSGIPPPRKATPRPSTLNKPLTIEPEMEPAAGGNSGPSIHRPTLDAPPPAMEAPPATDDLPLPPKPKPTSPPEPVDPRVTHVFLNPTLTGGSDFDQRPGDDGLSILIEPRNGKEQFVPQAGAVSVAVIDPAQSGEAARIARWDFEASAMLQKLQQAGAADGIHLQLPWPAARPEHSRLRLFVRYETADGRKLQTDRDIHIALPGQFTQTWTPRAADKPHHLTPEAESPAAEASAPRANVVVEPAPPSRAKLLAPPPSLGELPAEVTRPRTARQPLR
jgi:hypothetical protein